MSSSIESLRAELDDVAAATSFSGVVRVDRDGETALARSYGLAYLRSDELPERTATGYLDAASPRTNVLHLPVRGSGDGGAYTTVADVHAFWTALLAGRIVAPGWVERTTRPGGRAQPE